MEGRDRLMREKRVYEASLSGNVESLNELMQEDRLTLARASVVTCFNETPLHIASMLGHVDFAKALLHYKPDLVREIDSQGCSPLHVSSANGFVEIVKVLLMVDSDVCLLRDEDRRTPLHLAVMKGRIEVVKELIQARPEVIWYGLEGGETILHLCVTYNRFEALKLLVELCGNDDLVNVKDDNGNTILHTATAQKQLETIKFLLSGSSRSRVNEVNGYGFTALDIIKHMSRDLKAMEIHELLVKAGALGARNIPAFAHTNTPHQLTREDVQNELSQAEEPREAVDDARQPLSKSNSILQIVYRNITRVISDFHTKFHAGTRTTLKTDSLMLVATVIAAMAYQAAVNPPGGVWQEDKLDPQNNEKVLASAGTSIMAFVNQSGLYTEFWDFNTLSFLASLSMLLLLVSGIPLEGRFVSWVLLAAMYTALVCMTQAYLISMEVISPLDEWRTMKNRVRRWIYVWEGVMAVVYVVHTFNFIRWVVKKGRKFVKKRARRTMNEGEGQEPQDQNNV
ncbi:unnamed protein product [Ilex paraguariensis]|uniref:PGG domain-containing protein n=1 Tax=Ilex paraguariensis TaxID=185542 RepID=A0ABC8RHT6_9AQUA